LPSHPAWRPGASPAPVGDGWCCVVGARRGRERIARAALAQPRASVDPIKVTLPGERLIVPSGATDAGWAWGNPTGPRRRWVLGVHARRCSLLAGRARAYSRPPITNSGVRKRDRGAGR
jgi:hypothetical protein